MYLNEKNVHIYIDVKVRKNKKKGCGIIGSIVNKAVDLLVFEAHLPGYNYCGPSMKLDKRLKRSFYS